MAAPLKAWEKEDTTSEYPGWFADPGLTPESSIKCHEYWQEVEGSLFRLTEELRLAVILVDIQELAYAEAALVLKIPVDTLKSRIARGRVKLRELWESHNLYRSEKSRNYAPFSPLAPVVERRKIP